MIAAGRLVGLARAGAASQPGSDGGRTDKQEEIPPLDRHPDTLPRVWRASHLTCPRPTDDGRRAQSTGGAVGGHVLWWPWVSASSGTTAARYGRRMTRPWRRGFW